MKKKVVIVSPTGEIPAMLLIAIQSVGGVDVTAVPFRDALDVVEHEVPHVIIVDDYTERESLVKSFQTFLEIKERLFPWQMLVRTGRDAYAYRDYIKRPNGSPGEKDKFRRTIRSLIAA